jgi:anti-sigma regulatory factor (Ser/Thr protein kinase)
VTDRPTDRERAEPWRLTVALDGSSGCIGHARHRVGGFLTALRNGHGVPVSQRAHGVAQLVVSELVTNAVKYAPGPALMDLRIVGGLLEIVVRDGDPVLPAARAADGTRVGQHGLEIVAAVAASFTAERTPAGKRLTVHLGLTDDENSASGS